MKFAKIFLPIFLGILLFVFFGVASMYFSFQKGKKSILEESFSGIVNNKFIDSMNRLTPNIVVNKKCYSVREKIYNFIELGDSVNKPKSDSKYIIKVYKLGKDSNWSERVFNYNIKIISENFD